METTSAPGWFASLQSYQCMLLDPLPIMLAHSLYQRACPILTSLIKVLAPVASYMALCILQRASASLSTRTTRKRLGQ